MDFIREINAFERWLEHNYLPVLSQLLWYKLFMLNNRAGWCEWVQVDNQRLMAMMHMESKNTFLRARDRLVEAKLVSFVKGKKGYPNKYKLYPPSSCGSYFEPQTAPQTAPQTGHISKQRQKQTEPPTPFSEIPGDFPESVRTVLCDWLQYKAERKETYKPVGLTQFFSLVRGKIAIGGAGAVCYAVRVSMASGWQGVVWDKMKDAPQAERRVLE